MIDMNVEQIEQTVARHLQALTQSIDAVLSNYTEASVLFTPNGPVRGLGELKNFYETVLASMPGLIEAVQIQRQDVNGDTAYVVWTAEPYFSLASDTFVIRDGKIMTQTFVGIMPSG